MEESYLLDMRLTCQHKPYSTSRVDEDKPDKEGQVHVPGCSPADCMAPGFPGNATGGWKVPDIRALKRKPGGTGRWVAMKR